MEEIISIDIGYNGCKISYQGETAKFPTAVAFATSVGISYGEENVYEFEGEKYYVGKEAIGSEAFSTSNFKFLYKFSPLLIYHILSKFKDVKFDTPIIVKAGLSISDWEQKAELIERISNITVNGETIQIEPILIPQGAGVMEDWIHYNNNGEIPRRMTIIDIGYNTINLLGFHNGQPVRKEMKPYPGHGVVSIIKPFTSFMEHRFKMAFSEQEVIDTFIEGQFKLSGVVQEDVTDKITELKRQFVAKLFHSVLINDKKQIELSDVTVLAGGGVYMLKDVEFEPNIKFASEPYEFSNVRGYAL